MDIQRIRDAFLNVRQRLERIDLCLVTEDGFPIASTMDTGDREEEATAVGAIMCGAGERGVREMRLGNLETIVTTGTTGFFVVTRLKEGVILMAVAPNDITLGMVLMRVKKLIPELTNAID